MPLYLRSVAVLFLAAGLARACLVLGLTPSGESFATLTPAWRAGAVALMSLNLFAGVGLWIGATWGPVMWAAAALTETAMYTILAGHFGSHPLRVGVHVLLLSIYLGLAVFELRRARADWGVGVGFPERLPPRSAPSRTSGASWYRARSHMEYLERLRARISKLYQ